MGARLAVLISLLLLAAAVPCEAVAGSCLRCHPRHYQELGACVDCHRGETRSIRPEIAHYRFIPGALAHFMIPGSPVAAQGKKLMEQLACRRCHLIGRKGNRLAADLDRAIPQVAPKEIETSILQPAPIMPDFRLPASQAAGLINALYAAGRGQGPAAAEHPRQVHFTDRPLCKDNPFVRFCGACHQVLTRQFGGLGEGSAGPNLSGLLTPFYPASFGKNQPWTPGSLVKWLHNPRESRPHARMPPVRLQEQELKELLAVLLEPGLSAGIPKVGD